MLDERLSREENNALETEDVYEIYEIFDNVDSCIEFIYKNTNMSLDKIQEEFNRELREYNLISDINDFYSVEIMNIDYIVFKTGRVARVDFY